LLAKRTNIQKPHVSIRSSILLPSLSSKHHSSTSATSTTTTPAVPMLITLLIPMMIIFALAQLPTQGAHARLFQKACRWVTTCEAHARRQATCSTIVVITLPRASGQVEAVVAAAVV
jgi:hypothetical protein